MRYYKLMIFLRIWRSMRIKIESVLDPIAPVRTFKFRCTKPGWLSDDKKQARNIRNLVNHYVKRARSEFLKEQLENLKDKPKDFWNILNDIINPGIQANNFKLTDIQGTCMGDKEAAESINNFFAQLGKNLAEKIIKDPNQDDLELKQLKPPTFEQPHVDLVSFCKIT